jgi:hypothetical protein
MHPLGVDESDRTFQHHKKAQYIEKMCVMYGPYGSIYSTKRCVIKLILNLTGKNVQKRVPLAWRLEPGSRVEVFLWKERFFDDFSSFGPCLEVRSFRMLWRHGGNTKKRPKQPMGIEQRLLFIL